MLRSPWFERLQEAADIVVVDQGDEGCELRPCVSVDIALNKWPELVHEIKDVHASLDRDSAQVQASCLQSQIRQLLDNVYRHSRPILDKARRNGSISEVPDSTSPNGFAFDSTDVRGFDVAMSYYTACSVLSQMIHHLSVFQGLSDESAWSEVCHSSSKMAMFIPYLRRLGKLTGTMSSASLCLAYEGAQDLEQEYIRDFILETEGYRKRFPQDRKQAEEYLVYVAKCLTGRQGFKLG